MHIAHRLGGPAILVLAGMAGAAFAQPSGSTPGRVYSTNQPAYMAPPGGNRALPPIPRQPGELGVTVYQPPRAVPMQPSPPAAPTLPSRPSRPSAPAGLPSARPSYTPAPAVPMVPARPGGSSRYGR